jgi:hypothetical protein
LSGILSVTQEDDKSMMDLVERLFRARYVRLLEEEVERERTESERLRAENRALMNSLLGTAGFPPVEFPEAPKPQPLPRLRKRSWHQLQAWREAGAGRTTTANIDEVDDMRTNEPVSHS